MLTHVSHALSTTSRAQNLFYNMQLNVDMRRNAGVQGHLNCWHGTWVVEWTLLWNTIAAEPSAMHLLVPGGGGGGVDDILRRLGNVETDVSELRSEVSAISTTVPHLATAASVSEIKSQIGAILATIPHLAKATSVSEILAMIPHLATKADVKAEIAGVRTEIADIKALVASTETKIIKWIIATTLTTAALAFSIARFLH